MAVLLFDLDAGLAGALGRLLVLAPFLVFLYFKVMNDILSLDKNMYNVFLGRDRVLGFDMGVRFVSRGDAIVSQSNDVIRRLSLSFHTQ